MMVQVGVVAVMLLPGSCRPQVGVGTTGRVPVGRGQVVQTLLEPLLHLLLLHPPLLLKKTFKKKIFKMDVFIAP